MQSTICQNCGGEKGIHHYRTMQCPVGGREAPGLRKQEYMNTTFEREDDSASRIAALEAENKLLLAALRTAETYYPRVTLLIVEDVPTPAPTIRALLNGGGK